MTVQELMREVDRRCLMSVSRSFVETLPHTYEAQKFHWWLIKERYFSRGYKQGEYDVDEYRRHSIPISLFKQLLSSHRVDVVPESVIAVMAPNDRKELLVLLDHYGFAQRMDSLAWERAYTPAGQNFLNQSLGSPYQKSFHSGVKAGKTEFSKKAVAGFDGGVINSMALEPDSSGLKRLTVSVVVGPEMSPVSANEIVKQLGKSLEPQYPGCSLVPKNWSERCKGGEFKELEVEFYVVVKIAEQPDPVQKVAKYGQVISLIAAEPVMPGELVGLDSDGMLRKRQPGEAPFGAVIGLSASPGCYDVTVLDEAELTVGAGLMPLKDYAGQHGNGVEPIDPLSLEEPVDPLVFESLEKIKKKVFSGISPVFANPADSKRSSTAKKVTPPSRMGRKLAL